MYNILEQTVLTCRKLGDRYVEKRFDNFGGLLCACPLAYTGIA
jgi:hypothetical protein